MEDKEVSEDQLLELEIDFQNADAAGRVRLNTRASLKQIEGLPFGLCEGQAVLLTDGELTAHGIVQYNPEEKLWAAQVDWRDAIDSGVSM
jgi:hypothetical protein